ARRVSIESARAPLRSPEPVFLTEAPPARGGRRRRQWDAEGQLRRGIEEPFRRQGESATRIASFYCLFFRTAFAFSNSFRQSCASESSGLMRSALRKWASANAASPCSAKITPRLPCALKLSGLRRSAFSNSDRASLGLRCCLKSNPR